MIDLYRQKGGAPQPLPAVAYTRDGFSRADLAIQPDGRREPGFVFFVAMRLAKLALLNAGLLEAADAAIAATEGDDGKRARIEWQSATVLRRDHPLVAGIGSALGLDEAAIDALFASAAKSV